MNSFTPKCHTYTTNEYFKYCARTSVEFKLNDKHGNIATVRIRVRITLVSLVGDRIVLDGCNLEEAFHNEGNPLVRDKVILPKMKVIIFHSLR